jgi:hypothetical protein
MRVTTSDGEAIVLNQVFSTDALQMLKSKMIGLGKISVSCSGIYQPSVFRYVSII